MCGIAGFFGFEDKELIKKMLDSMYHRGPDDYGSYSDREASIGNRRLSIIDISGGHQPMHNEDETVFVVFNGAIYNFLELKEGLEKKGHRFYSNCDTEVLVHLYEEYGDDFPKKLLGMFSIAIWDSVKKKGILSIDPAGKKPLHYFFDNGILLFASEIKSLLNYEKIKAELDGISLNYLLNLQFIPYERTLFKNIKKLLPGHTMIYENGKITTKRNWKLEVTEDEKPIEYYVKEIQNLFTDAVRRRLTLSDVPVGIFLSGGIDSSSVVGVASQFQKVKTYTVGFGEPTDELDSARFVSDYFETDHHEIIVENDLLKVMPEAVYHSEQPSIGMLQSYLVSNAARKHVKVILSGMGGDELFAGYDRDLYMEKNLKYGKYVPKFVSSKSLFNLINGLPFSLGLNYHEFFRRVNAVSQLKDVTRYYLLLRGALNITSETKEYFYNEKMSGNIQDIEKIFLPYFSNNLDIINQKLYAEFETKLPYHLLHIEDRMGMANSLESRAPLLDKRLVELAFSMPREYKLQNGITKYVFRLAMKDTLPKEVFSKPKWGFAVNPYYQFRKDLKDYAEGMLDDKIIQEIGINKKIIDKILNSKPNPKLRWYYNYLWNIVMLVLWYKIFIEKENPKNLT
ncbi:MAG: Glutamine--fructose-6-phosphate aminotransferase (isomerizing) [Candidatus Methanofastidiosum methylothiophilum]|uniref:Putative asparagine synthetase [glutamine-hydrolyzing] n=1 Tax=Candidatus Methanofastidiosum methylothiophilum TaxID=1705564 RepID=A0A150IY36_9EURY|nr:MAG: Glutamine--fructose-6-phosphate aminotransferase (isomerizing) [Candidatus Methanofastidiosum methylthiophilus]KYC48464.1 MAG: Glutamine--fructose-6-phosphate aminotransferase (isomerizing) [Candidatus Methanofastidiosum methylthiophilus]KYC49906.1 MAG: Glutamine--fructose-6-phosphate aminotransferase (isomerizing) [Candidatus Methanofastidiosum methylthiophilus]